MEASGCNVPTSSSSSFVSISFFLFSFLEALLGMALNAFIAAMSCLSGLRNKQLKPIDLLLTALGLARFCYLGVFLAKIFWISVSSRVFEGTVVYQMFKAAVWFLTSVCFCFSACLCSFYCIKIATFGHRLFVLLKLRLSRLVPWMLLVSVLGSLLNTYPFYLSMFNVTCKNGTGTGVSANRTLEDFIWKTNLLSLFVYCGAGFSVAFFVSFASSCLLLFSLWRHTRLMQNALRSFSHPSMAAHFQAVKTIVLLLIVDSVNFVGLMLLLSNVFSEQSLPYRVITVVIYVFPSVQSRIVIWGNPKLKRAFVRLTDCTRHMSLPWKNAQ